MNKTDYKGTDLVRITGKGDCKGCFFTDTLICFNHIIKNDLEMCVHRNLIFVKYNPIIHLSEQELKITKTVQHEQKTLF